jgi:hypothetical protein
VSPADEALIDRRNTRTLFNELVAGALCETRVRPSPMAVAYLVELLGSRVSADRDEAESGAERVSLAEALLGGGGDHGPERIRRLRRLGDHALFVAGFFGDSLNRKLVDLDYYGDIGRAAYANLAETLHGTSRDLTWPLLYTELSQGFDSFVDVLAAVGDCSGRPARGDLLRTYERYLRTGSPRDRAELLRLGQLPPERREIEFWQ